MALIGEEISAKGCSLSDVVDEVATLVADRANLGLNHGVVLVPEGLLSFLPEMAELMEETAAAAAAAAAAVTASPGCSITFADVRETISPSSARAAAGIPNDILDEMLASRDAHGNPALSAVETEKLLARLVARKLGGVLTERGRVTGRFTVKTHFCGYEGRSGLPTNFDATYAYALGHAAATLAAGGANGVVAAIPNPTDPPKRWRVVGAPLCRMLRAERRAGKDRLVIRKTLVDLEGGAFRAFAARRDAWRLGDRYSCPGPARSSRATRRNPRSRSPWPRERRRKAEEDGVASRGTTRRWWSREAPRTPEGGRREGNRREEKMKTTRKRRGTTTSGTLSSTRRGVRETKKRRKTRVRRTR